MSFSELSKAAVDQPLKKSSLMQELDLSDILRKEGLMPPPRTAAESPIDPGKVHEIGTTTVSYNDIQIDNQLAFSQSRKLKITDIPNDCRVSAWKDAVGYFFYFTDGKDGKKRHYIPASCQFIELVKEDGKREVASVYEMKQQVDKAMDKNKPKTVV